MEGSRQANHSLVLVLAIGVPFAWMSAVFFGLGVTEAVLGQGSDNGLGERLDTISYIVWIVGWVVVPLVALGFSRRWEAAWGTAVGLTAMSLLSYAVGTVVAYVAFVLVYSYITGDSYLV